MKKINAAKLKRMGYAKVREACMVHAMKALTYKRDGNQALKRRHTDLLDQCAVIGRELKSVKDRGYRAKEAIDGSQSDS
jgi:hypothetical protein